MNKKQNKIDSDEIFKNIYDLTICTLIATEINISHLIGLHLKTDHQNFELFGFDVMLDENLKPWLIEVNIAPALKTASYLDKKIKDSLLADTFNIVGKNKN